MVYLVNGDLLMIQVCVIQAIIKNARAPKSTAVKPRLLANVDILAGSVEIRPPEDC